MISRFGLEFPKIRLYINLKFSFRIHQIRFQISKIKRLNSELDFFFN